MHKNDTNLLFADLFVLVCNLLCDVASEFPCSPSATEGGRKFPCGAGINNRWNNLRKSSAATSKS